MNVPEQVIRRYTFKVYPTKVQAEALERHRVLHQRLYNAALQERIDCYRLTGKTLSLYDQSKHVKTIRANDPEYRDMSADSAAQTLARLDNAFKAFFRRAKQGAGAQSGFPRFQSVRRYPGFSVRLDESPKNRAIRKITRPKIRAMGGKRFRLKVQGVGDLKLRGKLPVAGLPRHFDQTVDWHAVDWRTADLIFRDGTWWLSAVIKCKARREAGEGAAYLHWDLTGFSLHPVSENGGCAAAPEGEEAISDPVEGGICPTYQPDSAASDAVSPESGASRGSIERPALAERDAVSPDSGASRRVYQDDAGPPCDAVDLDTEGEPQVRFTHLLVAETQRKAARCKKGSVKWRKRMRRMARLKAKETRQRADWMHNTTTSLASDYSEIRVSDAMVSEFTKSGRGSERRWGAAVKDKAKGNRAILDLAPANFISALEYKLAEGGGELIKIDVDEADTLKTRMRDMPQALIAARALHRLTSKGRHHE